MIEPRMRFLWPLGPLPIIIPGLIILGIVLSGTSDMFTWPYQEWTRTSSQFMWQLAITGPIAAASATYYAGRVTPPSRIFAQRSSVRPARTIQIRQVGLLLAGHLTGYVLGFVPLLVMTAARSQYGGPDLLVMLTGVTGLVAATMLGYLIGVWSRSAVFGPLSFVLVLGVTVIGSSQISALPPVPSHVLTLGEQASPPLLIYRLVLLILVITATAQISAGLLRVTSRMPALTSFALVPLIIVGSVVPGIKQPTVATYQTDAPRRCGSKAGVEYCVHLGHQQQLAEFITSGSDVVQAYGFVPGRAARIYDRALLGTARADQLVIWPSMDPGNAVGPSVTAEVANTLAGTQQCVARYGFQPPQDVATFTTYLYAWLHDGGRAPDYTDGYNPFRNVSVSAVQQWIKDHDAQIASCSVDLRTLPR